MKAQNARRSFAFVSITLGAILLAPAADDDREKLTRLTRERIPSKNQNPDLCAPPPKEEHTGFHLLHLYANEKALDYRRENPEAFDYPIGSVFRKVKYAGEDAEKPHLATIMKRVGNKGTVEDWEFRMVTLPDEKEVTEIRKEICADCHSKYEKRGFVSRETETALRQKLKFKSAPPSTNDAEEDEKLLHPFRSRILK